MNKKNEYYFSKERLKDVLNYFENQFGDNFEGIVFTQGKNKFTSSDVSLAFPLITKTSDEQAKMAADSNELVEEQVVEAAQILNAGCLYPPKCPGY